jgi:hypothetical protein
MNEIGQFVFVALMLLLTWASVYGFRWLVRRVDARADYLAAKYASQELPKWSRLVMPVAGVLILIILFTTTIGAVVGLTLGNRIRLAQLGSQFVVISYEGASLVGGLAIGVVLATMVLPSGLMQWGGERLQWAYLRVNYFGRRQGLVMTNEWLRTLLSAGYLISAVVLPWIGISDFVRLSDTAICRQRFTEITERCVAFEQIDKFELKHETDRRGESFPVLTVFDGAEIWISIQPGMTTSATDIQRIWIYLSSLPGVSTVETH